MDKEEDIDTPIHVEYIVDENIELTKLHHTSGVDVLPPCINLKEVVVYKDIEYAYDDVSPSTSISNKYVIINTPPWEIIVDTLHHEMMAMSGSEPMTPVLCQVMSHPPLEDIDELKSKKILQQIRML